MNNEVDLLYEYLSQFKESGEAEILWRIARAFCDKAKLVSDVDIKKRLIQEAFSFAESGLRVGENNFACHKVHLSIYYLKYFHQLKQHL